MKYTYGHLEEMGNYNSNLLWDGSEKTTKPKILEEEMRDGGGEENDKAHKKKLISVQSKHSR